MRTVLYLIVKIGIQLIRNRLNTRRTPIALVRCAFWHYYSTGWSNSYAVNLVLSLDSTPRGIENVQKISDSIQKRSETIERASVKLISNRLSTTRSGVLFFHFAPCWPEKSGWRNSYSVLHLFWTLSIFCGLGVYLIIIA